MTQINNCSARYVFVQQTVQDSQILYTVYMICCNQICINHNLGGLRFIGPSSPTKYIFIPTYHLSYLKRESTFCCFQIWNCCGVKAKNGRSWHVYKGLSITQNNPPLYAVNCTTIKLSFTLENFWSYTWYAKLKFCLLRIWINKFLVVQYGKMIWVSKGLVYDCT